MLGGNMELRHLRYFVAVAGEENVSKAALKLHVSQPALSRQIRDLEDELGFDLLERSAKSVSLTEAGRVFWDEAEAILKRVDEGVAKAKDAAQGGDLHVGYAPSPTARFLPAVLRAFQAEVPGTRVRLHDLTTDEMLKRLRNGALQVALIVKPRAVMLRGLESEEIARDALALGVAPGHALARRKSVSLREFSSEPLVAYSREEYPEYYRSLVSMYAAIGKKPAIAEEHDGINSLVAAVEAGSGVAIVSESVACLAGPRMKLVPIKPSPEPVIICAVWSKPGASAAARQFLEHARAAAGG